MRKHDSIYTGGCKTFYSPHQWRERGEAYGGMSHLVVVHDGGGLSQIVNGPLLSGLQVELRKLGLYLEPCTCWYSAIYHA